MATRVFKPRVIHSTFSPDDLANIIGNAYAFEDVRCQLIKATVRDTYHVWADDRQYILYVYRHQPRNRSEIEAEIALITHCHASGLPVAGVVAGDDEHYLLELDAPEGMRYAVLFHYVSGSQLSKKPKPEQARDCGRLIARFHATVRRFDRQLERPTIGFEMLVTESIASFAEAAAHRKEDLAFLAQVAAALRPKFEGLSGTDEMYGIVHGHLIPSNILIDTSGQPMLIDFDFCGYGWQQYDIATFFHEADYWSMGDEIKTAFLDGYQSIRPLMQKDFEVVRWMQIARAIFAIGVPAAYVNSWGTVYLSDPIIDKQIALIRQGLSDI